MRMVESLQGEQWPDIAERLGRKPSQVIDALNKAMTLSNHHDWTKAAADPLFVGAADLWRVMCAAWVEHCANDADCAAVVDPIRDALNDK
jgi:hypothetical protein